MTRKEFISKYNGKTFRRTLVKGYKNEELKQYLLEAISKLPNPKDFAFREDDNAFYIDHKDSGAYNIFVKNKLDNTVEDTLEFKSTYTMFHGSRGELPKASEIDGTSFIKQYDDNNAIKFELVEEA